MKQINIYFILMLIMLILVIIMILLSVAFLTLMERKLLSYIQVRKGPNKLGILGIFQPFSDAIKLMTKEFLMISKSNFIYYLYSPIFMFLMIFLMWLIYPMWSNLLSLEMSFIYLLCCLSISVYGFLVSGWSSNSFYSMLGSIRSLSQSISYEVSLSLIMIISMLLINSMNFKKFMNYQEDLIMFMYLWPLSLMFFFSLMAELNRTPFDFSEGESELVSGFNVEYMSSGFILIFLSEYASIILLSFFFNLMFLGGNFFYIKFYLNLMIMIFLVIWIRGTLPRFRYDFLMYLCWLMILPITLNYMIYILMFKYMIFKLKMMEI